MKKYNLLPIAAFSLALFATGCQKENMAPAAIANTTTAAASHDAALSLLPSPGTSYGALISTPAESASSSVDFKLNVADQLGISCMRSATLVPASNKLAILNTNYKIALNFNGDFEGTPIPFVADLVKYKSDLNNLVSTFTVMPVMAVIENEESNLKYYSGNTGDYLKQLSTAVDVMHAYGIKVANGGVTSVGLNYLVYQDYMSQGRVAEAKDFQKRTHLAVKDAVTQNRGAFVDTLLKAYAGMNLDYVNFHWYASTPDSKALGEAIAYLKKATGKTIITNELGQFDTDPATLTALMQECTTDGLAYVLWYSGNADSKATPLHNSDGSLTTTGVTYKAYLAQK